MSRYVANIMHLDLPKRPIFLKRGEYFVGIFEIPLCFSLKKELMKERSECMHMPYNLCVTSNVMIDRDHVQQQYYHGLAKGKLSPVFVSKLK
jgi:hypothetical protein